MILDIAPTELLVLGAVALLVIPPKDLPRAMRFAGQWIGRARGLARQFRSGFDDMIREAEFAEMEKKWKAENERIMREFPQTPDLHQLMAPEDKPAVSAGDDDGADAPATIVEQPAILSDPEPIAPAPAAPAKVAKPRARKTPAATGASPAAKPAPRARSKTARAAPSADATGD